jgi:hypothetical protein
MDTMSLSTLFVRKPVAQPIAPLALIGEQTVEYRTLAQKLGVILEVGTDPLENILRAEFIHIYPMAQVSKYLSRITPKRKVWGWKCLRAEDYKRSNIDIKNRIIFGSNTKHGMFLEGIYNRPIPLAALMTIDKIEEATKHLALKPAFFVSDYAVAMPDPFLMVTIPSPASQEQEPNGNLWVANPEPACFVVERWDEPSFR